MGDTAEAEELLDAIRSRDGARIASCFATDAKLRALRPHRLREEDDAGAIAARYAPTGSNRSSPSPSWRAT